jgi:hypothetical protein
MSDGLRLGKTPKGLLQACVNRIHAVLDAHAVTLRLMRSICPHLMGTCVRDTPSVHREKARQMRTEKDLTIDEIAERLAISRQTIFHWVRDLPMRRARRSTPATRRRDQTNALRFKQRRDIAYEQGVEEFDELAREPTFRDFVSLYVGEGSKRNRNEVEICNSDPKVLVVCDYWLRRLTCRPVSYSLQYHADQDVDQLRRFWGQLLRVDPESIRLQRKSNSDQLAGRTWRSIHGVLSVRTCDTYLRARLQAWIDRLTEEWLDSPIIGA